MKNNPDLTQRTISKMGIEALNEMQLEALEANEKDKDMILLSPTGSGKTLAYLLPILHCLVPEVPEVQALILAPTRELVQQIEKVWRSMSTGYKVNSCFGGRPSNGEKRDLQTPPALLIGTPGRIQDHVERGNFSTQNIRMLVLDEFDKSLEMGFTVQMESILGLIPNVKKRILTSATAAVSIPTYTGIKNPLKFDFTAKNESLVQLKNYIVKGNNNDKLELLYRLLCQLGEESSLVFCNKREDVERLSDYLYKRAVRNEFFHGKLEQADRERALSKFRNASCMTLISTDLASRGLDIPDVKNIIHFDVPPRLEEYIHRNGRTARMGAKGNTFLLLNQQEDAPKFISPLPTTFTLSANTPEPPKQQWATLYISKGKKEKISKMDVVGFMFKKGELSKNELGKVEIKDFYSYVAVKADKASKILLKVQGQKIKNMKVRIELAD